MIIYVFFAVLVLIFFLIHLIGLSSPPNTWPSGCDQQHQQNCARLTNISHFGIPDQYSTPVTLQTSKNGGLKLSFIIFIFI